MEIGQPVRTIEAPAPIDIPAPKVEPVNPPAPKKEPVKNPEREKVPAGV